MEVFKYLKSFHVEDKTRLFCAASANRTWINELIHRDVGLDKKKNSLTPKTGSSLLLLRISEALAG